MDNLERCSGCGKVLVRKGDLCIDCSNKEILTKVREIHQQIIKKPSKHKEMSADAIHEAMGDA